MLPILARCGYKRRDALKLPSWEFWALVEAHQELEAQFLLDVLNMQSIASGNLKEKDSKDLMKAYSERAGLNKWKKEQRIEKTSWVDGLKTFLSRGR